MSERLERRRTFDEVAELYARARASYPPEVVDDVLELGGLRRGSRIVEIGCGTGQATADLARRGLEITCVELGARLAEVARRELASFPSVRVVTADFERWQADEAPYDGVVAFTAFHWLDPQTRYERAASVLRRGGALAVVKAGQVDPPGVDPFFAEVQDDYRAAGMSGDGAPVAPDAVPDLREEMEASGLFDRVTVRRRQWQVPTTADEYVALLGTASDHLLLPAERREELFERIRRRIESRPDGRIVRTVLAVVQVARRA
jgi:SAM-dependent methyltransferase